MGANLFGILISFTLLWSPGTATDETLKVNQVTHEQAPVEQEGSGISVTVNKPLYTPEESIAMTLRVFNYTSQEITFSFTTAQRYEFTMDDAEGQEVWHWSDGRIFAQVIGKETLGPGREEMVYTETYAGPLEPGGYKVTGILVASDRTISASITITIR